MTTCINWLYVGILSKESTYLDKYFFKMFAARIETKSVTVNEKLESSQQN